MVEDRDAAQKIMRTVPTCSTMHAHAHISLFRFGSSSPKINSGARKRMVPLGRYVAVVSPKGASASILVSPKSQRRACGRPSTVNIKTFSCLRRVVLTSAFGKRTPARAANGTEPYAFDVPMAHILLVKIRQAIGCVQGLIRIR